MTVYPYGFCLLGCKITRANTVDLNVMGCPFDTHVLGQHFQSTLCSSIGPNSISAQFAHHGANVDDLTCFALDHSFDHRFGNDKRTDQINFDDLLKIGHLHVHQWRAFDDPGIINQNINGAHFILNSCDCLLDFLFIGYIKTIAKSLNSFGLESGYGLVNFFLRAVAINDYSGSGLTNTFGHSHSQPVRSTSNQSDLSGQIK